MLKGPLQKPIAGLVINATSRKVEGQGDEPQATVITGQGDTRHVSFRNIFNIIPDPADPKGILKKLYPIGTPTPDMAIPLLNAVVRQPNLLTSIDGVHFRKLLAHYGIQPQMADQSSL